MATQQLFKVTAIFNADTGNDFRFFIIDGDMDSAKAALREYLEHEMELRTGKSDDSLIKRAMDGLWPAEHRQGLSWWLPTEEREESLCSVHIEPYELGGIISVDKGEE